jgi:hypothetical protein
MRDCWPEAVPEAAAALTANERPVEEKRLPAWDWLAGRPPVRLLEQAFPFRRYINPARREDRRNEVEYQCPEIARPAPLPAGLHLGCGKHPLPGWLNIDLRPSVERGILRVERSGFKQHRHDQSVWSVLNKLAALQPLVLDDETYFPNAWENDYPFHAGRWKC